MQLDIDDDSEDIIIHLWSLTLLRAKKQTRSNG